MKSKQKIINLILGIFSIFATVICYGQPGVPSKEQIDNAEQYSVANGGQTFIVVHNGNILRESYSNGGSQDKVQLLASATKGFTGMTGAIAAFDGIIDLDQPVVEVLTEWKNDPQKAKITYRHFLTMSSGLEELKDQAVWTDFLNAKLIYLAGTTFVYGPDPNPFGLALQRKLGGETVESYMKRRLFDPLGIRVEWRGKFQDGNPQLSGGAYVRANEWLKFGEFVRQMLDGTWKGPQIVSKSFFDMVFASSPPNPAYGFYWWFKRTVPASLIAIIDSINSDVHTRQIQPIIESKCIPSDFVMCRGAYGQCLYVIPSLKLVIVRNAPQGASGASYRDVELLNRLLCGLSADCTNSTTITASTPSTNAGGTISFTASTRDPNPTYTWQGDFGQGFQTITDLDSYKGAATNTLTISPVRFINSNQQVRVITMSGTCIDTSNVLVVQLQDTCVDRRTVRDTIRTSVSVTDTLIIEFPIAGSSGTDARIRMLPNPTKTRLIVLFSNFSSLSGYTFSIAVTQGATVFTAPIDKSNTIIDIGTWNEGTTYSVKITDRSGMVVATKILRLI